MTQAQRLARLRALEFSRIFSVRFSPWVGRVRRLSLLERLFNVGVIVVSIPYAWFVLSLWRGYHLEWTDPEAVFLAQAAAWLLWGLGGAIPVVFAMRAGWGWPEQGGFGGQGLASPMRDLLPLTNRQVLSAKLQGRIAALAVWCGVGLAILAWARQIMVTHSLVRRPPSLIDPWLVGSLLLFYAFFVASTRVAGVARRRDSRAAAGSFTAMVVGAVGALALAGACGYLTLAPWLFTNICAVAALAVTAAAAGQSLGRRRAPERAPPEAVYSTLGEWMERQEERARSVRWLWASRSAWASMGLRGLGGHVGQSWRWLRDALPLTVLSAVLAALVSILLQIVGVVWVIAHGGGRPLGARALEEATGVGVMVPLLAFSVLMGLIPIGVWAERRWGRPAADEPVPSLGARLVAPHLGVLMPRAAREVWRQRLFSLLLAALHLMVAAAASHLAGFAFRGRLLEAPLAGTLPVMCAVLGVALLASLCVFAFAPVLRMVAKTMELPGCLLGAMLMLGALAVPVAELFAYDVGLLRALVEVRFAYAVLLAGGWTGLLLVLSWVWCEPSAWRPLPDGSRSAGSVMRAFLVLCGVSVTVAGVFGLIPAFLSAFGP